MITTSIYIEVEYTQPDILFTADTTLVTADDTTHTADETLISSGVAGVKYERIELFTDEQITINSTITNYNDIGKLFADFTKSFTIPASEHNNSIFKDWYESAIGESILNSINLVEGTAFDHRKAYNGYIEIDTIPFKKGVFTMQKANIKKGQVDSYSINFTGNIVQLSDKFKDDKLNQVDFSFWNTGLTLANVSERIGLPISPSYENVLFPIIGSEFKYEYDTGNVTKDITLLSGGIKYYDLFPAIKTQLILNRIQYKYGLTFTGAFLNSTRIKKEYLYCKNAEKMQNRTELTKVNFVAKTQFGTHPFNDLDLTTDTLNLAFRQRWQGQVVSLPYDQYNIYPNFTRVQVKIITTSTDYNFYVYNNDLLYASYLNVSGTQTFTIFQRNGSYSETYNFTFYVNSDVAPVNFTSQLQLLYVVYTSGASYQTSYYGLNLATPQVTANILQIQSFIPDITIADFISGFVKKHNLMIIPINDTTFEFKPLEVWYNEGNVKDITEFITDESIEINRPNLYKRIDFKYQKSENILNNNFYTRENLYYGDLFYDNPENAYSENYEIELPFEDFMFERSNPIEDFLTATCIDKNQNAYVPAPTFLYLNDFNEVTGTFLLYQLYVIDDVGGSYHLSNYRRFSNEVQYGGTDLSYVHSNNWGVEISPWYRDRITNGLYFDFYSNFILNLYNQRTRVVKCKGIFNTNYISELKINDRIILANKRYVINTMDINLSTGEISFELINDFRQIESDNADRFTNIPILQIDNTEQTIEYLIYIVNYDTFDVKSPSGFLTYTTSTDNTNDINLEVTIPENTTGVERLDLVVLEYFKDGVSTFINLPVIQAL